jgi:sugar phosphate permease
VPGSRRWVVLAAGTLVQTSQAAMYAGLAVLAPVLRDRYDLSLTEVGVLLGGSSVGALLTLLPWGLAADRVGERFTATVGLVGAAGAIVAAAYADDFLNLLLLFVAASACGASTNTATGRAITSWFPRDGRGFALGIRQTAIPIGGFTAALGLPPVVDAWGLRAALLALASFSGLAALTAASLLAEGPIRSLGDGAGLLRHPLRDRRIWRLSLCSALLAVTQVAVAGFVVLFLESQRDFSHTQAGAVLAGMNVLAAAGRLGSGRLSDQVGSRVGLMRAVALAAALAVGLATALLDAPSELFLPALVLGGGLAMSWNGLAVAATVEAAGARRSGAALGFQQTLIQVGIVATPLAFAPFVSATSWRSGFAVAAAVPIAAALLLRPLGR